MQTITTCQDRAACIVNAAALEPTVRVVGFVYLVELGEGVKPRLHTIFKEACSCGQEYCPAVEVVADWLAGGRIEAAPVPPTGYEPFIPKACPICGDPVFPDHTLDSRTRGAGWLCLEGGITHYWQHKWNAVKGWFFREDIIPGVLKRGDVSADSVPMGYWPEAQRQAVR